LSFNLGPTSWVIVSLYNHNKNELQFEEREKKNYFSFPTKQMEIFQGETSKNEKEM
jgi:hypothetical protein